MFFRKDRADALPGGFVRHQLYIRPRDGLVREWFMLELAALCVVGFLVGALYHAGTPVRWLLAGLVLRLATVGIIVWAIRQRPRWEQHPDVLALARYGEPAKVLRAIEADLSEPAEVLRFRGLGHEGGIGHGLVREPDPGEVIVTPSWLLYIPVFIQPERRLTMLRLADLVCVSRADAQSGLALLLTDRHGASCTILASEATLPRLMAELLVRVPWALRSFEEEGHRTVAEERTGIVGEGQRRRADIEKAEELPRP